MTDPEGLTALVGRSEATVPELFEARCRATPDATFLRWQGRAWTYAEARAELRRFAAWAQEVTGDDDPRIAAFLGNRPEMVWTWLGTLEAGAVFVPLNRAHRGELLTDMLRRSGATALVTDREGLELLPPLAGTGVELVLVVDGPASAGDVRHVAWDAVAGSAEPRPVTTRPGDVAELLYTSGTTGRSKAVALSHNQLCRGAAWLSDALGLRPDDVLHAWLPLFHIGGQLDMVLVSVVAGGEVALFSRFSRSAFWSEVAAVGATVFIGFSNVVELLWSLPERPEDRDVTLRIGILGGIPPDLHRGFEERFGLRMLESYGMTEVEPIALPTLDTPVGAAGRPRPDLQVAILDDQDLPVPTGRTGEICLRPRRPRTIFEGYEGDDAATLQSMSSLWFHTGDVGRLDAEGFLSFIDRKQHSIRRRGENISSWELERIIAGHEAVAECAAVGVPAPLGEDDVKVVVAPHPGRTVEPADLRLWCQTRMASFMVPRFIEVRDALPRLPTGKIEKRALHDNGPRTFDAERA